ncbi:spermatogenesis-associated protein 7 homolog isoform 2-T2 [Pholidichthys leucotaenia]
MESRTGSVSSGLDYSTGVRGHTSKSSSVIDTSMPKSMLHNVKYNDRIRRECIRKGGRPQSAPSQRNGRASCSSSQSRLSVQCDGSPYPCLRSSMLSSPRFSTSFDTKAIVYASYKFNSHHAHPASEKNYRGSEPALQRKRSASSLDVLGDHGCHKTFQDPSQKTYSGDLLKKHSQHFTQEKPFTPQTLKSDKGSNLLKYRYYRAPQRKPTQDCNNSRLKQQEINHKSTKNNEDTEDFDVPSQGFRTDHEGSEDDFNGKVLLSSRQQSRATKSREHYFDSPPRVSLEGVMSPNMKRVSEEEEELMYLQFISAVTEDILSRGHISVRVLDRVMEQHINMNLYQLDEGKMRHLLDMLHKDLEDPNKKSPSSTELDKLLLKVESAGKQVKTKEENDLFRYVSLKSSDTLDHPHPLLMSAPLASPEMSGSTTEINEKGVEGDSEAKGVGSPLPKDPVLDNTPTNEEEFHQKGTAARNYAHIKDREYAALSVQDQADIHFDVPSKELEDLGRSLLELQVSSSTRWENTDTEQQTENTVASVSDEEF